MKHILFTKELLLLVVALFVMIATSCIKEDLDQCYTLKLKVENIKGDDITEYGWMESTDLYIFDANLNYLEKRRLDKNFIRSAMRSYWMAIPPIVVYVSWHGAT